MSLQSEIRANYIDGNGLVSPSVCSKVGRASDNGPLFTAQYLVNQRLNGEELDTDAVKSMISCIDSQGYLHRAPDDTTEDAPDDHYGVLSALVFLDIKGHKVKLPIRCWHPVLLYLSMLNSSIIFQIATIPLRILANPLIALIILLSNTDKDKTNTSNRLISWMFMTAVSKQSALCNLAFAIWLKRIHNLYGDGLMQTVAGIYFQMGHPLVKHWKTI